MWLMIALVFFGFIGMGVLILMGDDQDSPDIMAYLFFATAVIYLLIVLCLRRRIERCITLLRGASYFIKDHCSSMFISFFIFLFLFATIVGYGFIFGSISDSSTNGKFTEDTINTFAGVTAVFFLWALEFFTCYACLAYSIYIC
mmetsp:Transcript_142181/g.201183  ORF Transcript_142181/g.201183 Transcript_142181/m.201183 type:complete len:144 (+) Transcript_142181:443-874(+)